MYTFFLHLHSGLRWLALLVAISVVLKSIIGLFSNGQYSKLDNILSASFVGFMHTQFLIGLILYFFLSPYTTRFTFNMSDPTERFWSVEHISLMIISIVAAQIGRSISKKSSDSVVKFRFQSIFFGISLVLMLVGIPWNRI